MTRRSFNRRLSVRCNPERLSQLDEISMRLEQARHRRISRSDVARELLEAALETPTIVARLASVRRTEPR